MDSANTFPATFDFAGFIPRPNLPNQAWLCINHENTPNGAVSVSEIQFDAVQQLWERNQTHLVDFSAVVRSERNCSGALTPWGTMLSGEEVRTATDANGDGYADAGWLIEIQPETHAVADYGSGQAQKCWAMGHLSHENAAISELDWRTVYFGEDEPTGCLYKFVADVPGNLASGQLFALQLYAPLTSGNPTGTLGRWIPIPNTTPEERNRTYMLASDSGATIFNGIEDVEFGPNGALYFSSKGFGKIYRFQDDGATIHGFEVYAGGMVYPIETALGSYAEPWGIGNDNLAFDIEGNLWVLQDGDRNHIWVIRPGHTQENPQVSLFATTPSGCEPTGITFSPDGRFLFMSIQHPSYTNSAQMDALGQWVAFDASAAIVIARREFLGAGQITDTGSTQSTPRLSGMILPQPVTEKLSLKLDNPKEAQVRVSLFDACGSLVFQQEWHLASGLQLLEWDMPFAPGIYVARVISGTEVLQLPVLKR